MEHTGVLTLLTWAQADSYKPASLQAEDAYRALDDELRATGATIFQERVFGTISSARDLLQARERAVAGNAAAWAVPPTFIEGAPVGREGLAGVHVLALRADTSRVVRSGDTVLGRLIDAEGVRLIGLSDVGRLKAESGAHDPAREAGAAIDLAEQILEREGFTFRDVARTWYHLRDILDWYGPFNAARNGAFRRMGLIGPTGDGSVPASTGIGGRNARGGWCALDLVAARPTGRGLFAMQRMHNRRQNEATEYGSAFARGMSLGIGGDRYFFVSGTASIDDHGATVHVGDFEAQTRHTIEAIQALLEDAGATLGDIRQAMVFLKDGADAGRFARVAKDAGIADMPQVTVVADVCRDNLLVEIEATAVVTGKAEPRR